MGQFFNSMFGGAAESVDIPEAAPLPSSNETKDPVSQAVRDTERRRIMARRASTILSGPMSGKGNGILGKPM